MNVEIGLLMAKVAWLAGFFVPQRGQVTRVCNAESRVDMAREHPHSGVVRCVPADRRILSLTLDTFSCSTHKLHLFI